MNKKVIVGVIAIVIVVGLGWYFLSKKEKKEDTVKIGAILSLSGEYAEYGQNVKKGMDLALEKFHHNNPNINVKIIYEDNKGNAKDALTAYKKIKIQSPFAIIDGAISTLTLSIVPEITKDKIVLLSTGASNPSLSGISPYFFRVWNSDSEEGSFIAKKIYSKYGVGSINVLYINTDYGLGLLTAFKKEFVQLGGLIESEIAFNSTMIDFKDIISKIDFKKANTCYLIGYANQTALITKTIRTINKDCLIFSTVATEADQFNALAGESANNVIYAYNAPTNSQEYQNFKQLYKEKYGTDPQILTDVAFDALSLILEKVVGKEISSGEELRKFLSEMDEYLGASGNIKFDINGDVHKKMILKTIINNKFVAVESDE